MTQRFHVAAIASALAMSSQMGAVEIVPRLHNVDETAPRPPRFKWTRPGRRSNDPIKVSRARREKAKRKAAHAMRTAQRMRAKGKR